MFKKYPSIENSYREQFMNYLELNGFTKSDFLWEVAEKVHGANFQIGFNGTEMMYGKRTDTLSETTNFYDWQNVILKNDLENKIKSLYNYLKTNHMNNDDFELVIYGELAGNGVQKGIFYSTSKFFYAFDMKIDGEYQSSEVYTPLFEMFNIFYAKVLFKGTLKECLEYPNEYNSTIPTQLNEIAPDVNICEGNVVKPVIPKFMGDHRVILKNKNNKWSEKANKKKNDNNTPKQDISLTEEDNEILTNLLQYNTENRLKNVLSKVGEVSTKDFGKVMGGLMTDIYDDFKKESNVDLKTLSKQVKNKLQNEVSALIRRNWVNILDGIF